MTTHTIKRRKLSLDSTRNLHSSLSSLESVESAENGTVGNGDDNEASEDLPSNTDVHDFQISLQDGESGVPMSSSKSLKKSDHSGNKAGPPSSEIVVDGLRLQVRELLKSVKPHHGARNLVGERLVDLVKRAINDAPDLGPLPSTQAAAAFSAAKIAVPFPDPQPSPDSNHQYSYAKPEGFYVDHAGMFKGGVEVGTLVTTLAVQMPAAMFTAKDHLDHRYFHKRAFYLARIAAAISETLEADQRLSYELHDENPLLPVLRIDSRMNVLELTADEQYKSLRVMPYAPTSAPYPIDRIEPDTNCLRSLRPSSTPFYNASMLHDVAQGRLHNLLERAKETCSGFEDACRLGAIWLRQRGYSSLFSSGGFGDKEWSTLIALRLMRGSDAGLPMLLPSLDGLQLFRATLQFLAMQDLVRKSPESLTAVPEGERKNLTPVLFVPDLKYNLFYRMSRWSYDRLRFDSQTTLRALNRDAAGAFEGCFIYRVDESLTRYDFLLELPRKALEASPRNASDEPDILSVSKLLYSTLTSGLTDRVSSLYLRLPKICSWRCEKSKASTAASETLTICVCVNPLTIVRKVDRGPETDEREKLARFRKLWGGKTELRRFKDGSIREAVAWSQSEPRELLLEIISHLLGLHFSAASARGLRIIGNAFGQVKKGRELTMACFEPTLSAYQALEEELRHLEDMPLAIRQIRPASSALCYTSETVPTSDHKNLSNPIDVTVQFEGSGRWPDDLAAIQMTKVAFLLRTAELLQKSSSYSTRIGLENDNSETLNRSFLEVIDSNNFIFHVRIHHDREQSLIERKLKDRSTGPAERETNAAALTAYKKSFERRPALVGAMQILVRRHAALCSTARLLKRWFASHLLHSHISEELLDIVSAHVFLNPFPWSPPTSAMTGFLRTLLFLSKWDWQHEPLIVDFNSEMGKETVQSIRTRFEAWRKLDPEMNRVVVFAATNFDADGTTWTEFTPGKVIATRMTALAKAATNVVLKEGKDLDIEKLFKPSMKDYDFVLHLRPVEKSKATAKSKQRHTSIDSRKLFFEELQRTYFEAALFFTDLTENNVIAGIWQPGTADRSWKASLPFSTRVEGGGADRAISNKHAMLDEMVRTGGDLVRSVTQFPNGSWIENLAVRQDGTVLLSLLSSPDLLLLDPDTTTNGNSPQVLATFQTPVTGVLGIAEAESDVYYVATNAFDLAAWYPPDNGTGQVWRIDLTGFFIGHNPVTPELVASLPDSGLLNGVAMDTRNNILFTADSAMGLVWSLNVADGEVDVALNNSFTAPSKSNALGVNGNGAVIDSGQVLFNGIDIGILPDDFVNAPNGPGACIASGVGNLVAYTNGSGEGAGAEILAHVEGATSLAWKRMVGDREVLYVVSTGGDESYLQGPVEVGGAVYRVDVWL
ncbi:MAG: hypothetical protein Q9159_002584 [Coniocarpon cinnabarinum]